MGGGAWNATTYASATKASLKEHGTAFAYSKVSMAAGRYEAHESLDPKLVAGELSPFAGKVMREARDSDEHPESLPIAVIFDVTGSMHQIPQVLQEKLPKLYGLLLAKGYVEHPQILFGAVGDATCDRVPLQIGQFESDNRADENLANLFLEGGGGGGNHESYETAAYFVARHTTTDAWEKRGQRGYLFLIGDERAYSRVSASVVAALIGDGLQEDVPTKDIFDELRERWDVYYLFAREGSYQPSDVIDAGDDGHATGWRPILGQNAMILDDASAVCEVIALTVGLGQGVIDLDEGLDHLREEGTDVRALETAGKALATVGAGRPALGEADGDLDVGDEGGADRL
jgi:hypothetical protein